MLIIKEIIKSKGYSVTSLAERIGMTQVSLSRIINGNPTVETLEKIAHALDVDVRDLFRPTKPSETIHVIRDNKLTTFNSLEEFRSYVNKKIE